MTEQQVEKKNWSDFKVAVPITITFALLFIFLQKVGLINLVNSKDVNYSTAFVIGLVASVSSCMAVVGGLLLSISATFAKDGDRIKPQVMFHLGRIVSFFVLGGVIGAVGTVFTLNSSTTIALSLIIGLVMLILGIKLLDIFNWVDKIQLALPESLAEYTVKISKFNHSITPLLVGVVTFFLPCGFTQSMQLYTLTTGSFLKGGLTMFAFAIGTLPILALVSFSSFSIQNSSRSGVFFKSAGLIVIMFALFNILNSFVVAGIIPPIFNF